MKPKFTYMNLLREYKYKYEDEPPIRFKVIVDKLHYIDWWDKPDQWFSTSWKQNSHRKKQYLRHRRG